MNINQQRKLLLKMYKALSTIQKIETLHWIAKRYAFYQKDDIDLEVVFYRWLHSSQSDLLIDALLNEDKD